MHLSEAFSSVSVTECANVVSASTTKHSVDLLIAIMNSTSDTACKCADGRQAGRGACPRVVQIAGRQVQTDTNRHRKTDTSQSQTDEQSGQAWTCHASKEGCWLNLMQGGKQTDKIWIECTSVGKVCCVLHCIPACIPSICRHLSDLNRAEHCISSAGDSL